MNLRNFFLLLMICLTVVLGKTQPLNRSIGEPMACWFWGASELKPDGYRRYIDHYAEHSAARIITASLRTQGELTDERMIDQIHKAATYAQQKGLGLVMDLDIRLARDTFSARYPADLQEIVLIREFTLDDTEQLGVSFELPSFADHYTAGRTPFAPVGVRLGKVYSYEKAGNEIVTGTVADITPRAFLKHGSTELGVTLKPAQGDTGRVGCAMVVVTLSTPDIFSPKLIELQREILKQYAETGLVGAAKDEWGFPGRFHPSTDDLWYSGAMGAAYAKQHNGRELLRDLLLMAKGETGRKAERDAAINNYMRMVYERNGEIEADFFNATKEYFGPEAVVGTHPTWYPYPDVREIFKNGLSWWQAKRELAQTDEATPFSVRTALAKKWGSRVWYNMFYDLEPKRYALEIWRALLGGGRLNIHQPYPSRDPDRAFILLRDSLFNAIQRIQLVDYISSAPVNSPIALVFDHTSALNWSNRETFADIGLPLTDALWEQGFYTDLIPSSEVANGSLFVADNGKVQYGAQQYEVVIHYRPGFDDAMVSALFARLPQQDGTTLFRVEGQWKELVAPLKRHLKQRNIAAQTLGSMSTLADFPASVAPNAAGHVRLLDGTLIMASGEHNVMGDPIRQKLKMDGVQVAVDAIGVVGIRLDKSGKLEALACGGLKSFRAGGLRIELDSRLDVALVKLEGRWRGIIHGPVIEIPADLARITSDWTFKNQPVPLN